MPEALPDLSGGQSILTSGGFCRLGPVPKHVALWMAGAFWVAREVATANEIISFLEFADREGVDPNHVDRFLVSSKKVRLHTISKSDRGKIQKAKSQSRFWDILWADDGAHRFYHSKEVLRQIAGDETDYLDYVRRVVMALAIPPPLGTTYDDVVQAILRGNSRVEDLISRAFKYLNETGQGLPRSFEGLSETHPTLAEKIARYCRDRGMGFLTRPFVVVDEIGAREVSLPHALSTSTFKRLGSLGPRRATIHDIIVALDMAGNLLNDCALFLLRHVPGVAGMWGDLAIHYPWAKVFKTLPYVGGHYSDEWIAGWIERKAETWPNPAFGPWSVWVDGEFAGWAGVEPDGPNLSYGIVLLKKFWGFGSEVTQKAIGLIRESFPDADSMQIELPESRGSERFAKRLGLLFVGTIEMSGHKFMKYEFPLKMSDSKEGAGLPS